MAGWTPESAQNLIDRVSGGESRITPGGSLTERLSRMPESIVNTPIFGTTVGEVAHAFVKNTFTEENAFYTGAGALFRIGVGTAGVGGVPLAMVASGFVGGLKEHYKATNKEWNDKRDAQGVTRLGLRDTLEGFFTVGDLERDKNIALGIGKGATFGLVGNLVGVVLENVAGAVAPEGLKAVANAARATVGEKVGGAFGAVKDWRESWKLPGGEVKAPDGIGKVRQAALAGAEQIVKDPLYNETGRELQTEVIQATRRDVDKYVPIALETMGFDPEKTPEKVWGATRVALLNNELNELKPEFSAVNSIKGGYIEALKEAAGGSASEIHRIMQDPEEISRIVERGKELFTARMESGEFVKDTKDIPYTYNFLESQNLLPNQTLPIAPLEISTETPPLSQVATLTPTQVPSITPEPSPTASLTPTPEPTPTSFPTAMPTATAEPIPTPFPQESVLPSQPIPEPAILPQAPVPPFAEQTLPTVEIGESAIYEKIAQLPNEIYLSKGSTPWEVASKTLEGVLGHEPSKGQILEVTIQLAKSSGIAVPEWGTAGADHLNLPPNFKLVFDDSVKSVIKAVASK